jgi:hypothetical protein
VGGARWWAGGSSPWGGDDDASPLFDLSGSSAGLDGSPAPSNREPVTTIFCSDGSIVTLGPQRRHPLQAAERRSARRASFDPLPLPEEQGLCIGRWAGLSVGVECSATWRCKIIRLPVAVAAPAAAVSF